MNDLLSLEDWITDEDWIPCDWDDYLIDEFDP
jgi:hypothetical protein